LSKNSKRNVANTSPHPTCSKQKVNCYVASEKMTNFHAKIRLFATHLFVFFAQTAKKISFYYGTVSQNIECGDMPEFFL
jgi:hypothetical protein